MDISKMYNLNSSVQIIIFWLGLEKSRELVIS